MIPVAKALRMAFGGLTASGSRLAGDGRGRHADAGDRSWRLRAEERDAAILTDRLPLPEGEYVPDHRTEISFYRRGR